MADNNEKTEAQRSWLNFVNTTQLLLVPQVDDRPLDQYLAFRDAVLTIVKSEGFLDELNTMWSPTAGAPPANTPPRKIILPEFLAALLLELKAFPLAVEVIRATEKPEEPKKGWRALLGHASVVAGSLKDFAEDLPYLKGGLTLFGELLDLFRGKE